MPKEKALYSFRQPPLSLNCAQAIAHGFGREDLASQLQTCGGGKAPDGLCGALYAAMIIAGEPTAAEIADAFEKELGYRTCFSLKREGKVSCPKCVACAADLLSAKIG